MDNCFVNIAIEFLAIAFHNILYYAPVYPKCIFETRRKYNTVIYRSIHPEVNQYIDLCLKSINECLKCDQLNRVELALTDLEYKPFIRFVFQFNKNDYFDESCDPYLVESEQNLRAFCLKLSSLSNILKDIPENCTFDVYVYTDESTAVALSTNPDLEEFPLVEVEEKQVDADTIFPLRRFPIRNYNVDVFVELK